jgi:flagellar hook-basal body complex protein FliE
MSNVALGGVSSVSFPDVSRIGIGPEQSGPTFGDVLKGAIDSVDEANSSAASQVSNLLQSGNSDINSVMIAVEKADVSFQLMMQVRNKIVSAYQDIEKMQF